jgi:predicted anti-sigma-YlaC factor YlaD
MNCEHIQELILTDYLDGALAESPKRHLEDHLARCPQCFEFAKAAKITAFEAFERVEKVQPPEHLWARIEDAILEKTNPVEIPIPSWFERLKSLLAVPRPAYALITVLFLFLAVGTFNQFNIQKATGGDRSMEYLVSLMSTTTESSTSDSSDFGTAVEQYFL